MIGGRGGGRGGFQQRDMGPPDTVLGVYILFVSVSHNIN